MAETTEIRRVALVGGGVIGSGLAARCLAHGLDVVATDPAPGAEEKIRAGVANAWPALTKIGLKPGASQERLSFACTEHVRVRTEKGSNRFGIAKENKRVSGRQL